jgi:hypothetical protein
MSRLRRRAARRVVQLAVHAGDPGLRTGTSMFDQAVLSDN